MSHRFTFTVEVELERVEGLFAGRDEMAEAVIEELNGADPGSVDGIGANGDPSYEIVSWEATEA